MAYATKYLFKFESTNGTTREIRVLKDGYSGSVVQRPLGRAPVLKKQQNGPVHGTSLEFYAECNVNQEFVEFYTSDPKEYRVDLYAGSTLLWQGYITPELYSEPDIAPPYDVQVIATDGVGELKLYDFAPQGTVSLRSMLTYLLGRTGLGTDVYLVSSLKAGSNGAGALLSLTCNLDYMVGKTCYETLTYLLDTLHATITWWGGHWLLVRETNVTMTSGKVRYFNTAGNSALLAGSSQVLGKMYSNPAWPVGQLSSKIVPAKNKVVVEAPWHPVNGLTNPDMTSDTGWAKTGGAAYDSTNHAYHLPAASLSALPRISQELSLPGLRVPMTLTGRFTALSADLSLSTLFTAAAGFYVTYTVGTSVYHLERTDDGISWKSGAMPSLLGYDDSIYTFLRNYDEDRAGAREISIDIPPFVQNAGFPAGTLKIYIFGSCLRIYAASLDVVITKGYQDILHIDNGARGEGESVEVAFGRVSSDVAYYQTFLQGLLLDNGSLITAYQDANFTTNLDFLAFISRDYALSSALPRVDLTGTVFLESSVDLPPLVFTKGGLDYWLETFSWDLYNDELEISARTLPSASLTVESETVTESDGSQVSSQDSAGASSTTEVIGGGGVNYFEPDPDFDGIKLKDVYPAVRVPGLRFGDGVSDLDLEVVTVEGVRAIHSRLPFYSDSWVSAGGVSSGGGTGGVTTLAALTDVSLTNLSNGQMLAYDSTAQKWKNVAAPSGGGGTVTSVAMTVPTGLSVSGSPVTSSGTLAVTLATGYSIPTTTKQSNWDTAYGWGDHSQAGYLTTAVTSLASKTGAITIDTNSLSMSSGGQLSVKSNTFQPIDADLTAIAGLSGTSGLLKKTAANTWSLDTNTYLTGNQTITLSGDVSGSGATSISVSIGAGKVTNNMLAGSIANAKLANSSITIGSTAVSLGGTITNLTGIGSISATGALTLTTTKKIYFGNTSYYLELDSNGYLHTNVGFYSDSFVSAGGISSGGGTSGIDALAMWKLLTNNDSLTTYDNNTKIALAHLPYTAGTGLTLSNGQFSVKDNAYCYRGTTETISGAAPTQSELQSTGAYSGSFYVPRSNSSGHLMQFDCTSGSTRYVQIYSGYNTGMYWRNSTDNSLNKAWRLIYDSTSLTQSVVTTLIGNTTYAPYNSNGYLPLNGGTMTGQITIPNGSSALLVNGGSSSILFGTADTNSTFGQTAGTTYLRSGATNIIHRKDGTDYVMYDGSNFSVTLNGTSTTSASFYAPTSSGTANYVLISGGANTAPSWTAQVNIRAGKVYGAYTSNGGQQNPNYFGTNTVGFLMMNTTVNGNSNFKDWIIMDCYSGSDVGGAVAIGVNRQSLGLYIMRSGAERTSWAASAELYGTHNANSTSVAWSASSLTLAGALSGATSISATGSGTSGWVGTFTGTNAKVLLAANAGYGIYCYSTKNAAATKLLHLTYGDTNLDGSGSVAMSVGSDGNTSIGGTLTFSTNNKQISMTDAAAATRNVFNLNAGNNLIVGNDLKNVSSGGGTYIRGKELHLQTAADSSTAYADRIVADSAGKVGIRRAPAEYDVEIAGNTRHVAGWLRLDAGYAMSGYYSGYSYDVAGMDSSGQNVFGYGSSSQGVKATYIYGNPITFGYGTSRTTGMTINSSGNVTIGSSDSAGTSHKLYLDGNEYVNGRVAGKYYRQTPLYVNLSTAGWYRVFKSSQHNALSSSIILNIGRSYSNTNNETYTVSINIAFNGKIGFTQLSGNYQTKIITKVRVDYTNSGDLYVDIYYSSSASNTVWISGVGFGEFQAPTAVSSATGTTAEFSLGNGVVTNGNVLATGQVTAGSASDSRLKDNIKKMSDAYAMGIVMNANPVTFSWNKSATELCGQLFGSDLGLVAQEVEPYLPTAVTPIWEKYKRLDYTKLIAPMLKVAQNHELRIRELERENTELKQEIQRLRMN